MKLKSDCVITSIGNETVVVPTKNPDFHGVVKGNKTLAAIIDLLHEDITEEEIIAALHERYEAPEGAIESSVSRAISELRKLGMLDE